MESLQVIALATEALQAAELHDGAAPDCGELQDLLRRTARAMLEMVQERDEMASRLMRGGGVRTIRLNPASGPGEAANLQA